MAFPTNPVEGDTHGIYTYDATTGSWIIVPVAQLETETIRLTGSLNGHGTRVLNFTFSKPIKSIMSLNHLVNSQYLSIYVTNVSISGNTCSITIYSYSTNIFGYNTLVTAILE